MNSLIKLSNLKKTFKLSNKDELLLLENLNLNILQNTITSIIGPSGCGKSTLLNILGLLDSNLMVIIFLMKSKKMSSNIFGN